jgi:hypothetical protein
MRYCIFEGVNKTKNIAPKAQKISLKIKVKICKFEGEKIFPPQKCTSHFIE